MPKSKKQTVIDLIAQIRQDQLGLKGGSSPTVFDQARNNVLREVRQYVNELETHIHGNADDKTLDQTKGSLEVLKWNIRASAFLNGGLVMMHNINKSVTGRDHSDPQLLEQLGKDVLRTAKNYNELLDDSSKTMSTKVWTVMKAFASASIDGVLGMIHGAEKGFKEGRGFIDTVSSVGQGIVTGGFAGFNNTFATELNERDAGAMKKAAAQELINNIRENRLKPVEGANLDPLEVARNNIKIEQGKYLTELEDKLNNSSDPAIISQTLNSIKILDMSIMGSSMLHTGLKFMNNLGEKCTGEQRGDPKQLEQLGKDILSTTRSFNNLLDDSSKSLGSKVWTMTKAFASAVMGGIEGALNGLQKGWREGKGMETMSSMFQGSVAGGFSGFWQKFADSYDKQLAPPKQQQEASFTPLMLIADTESSPALSRDLSTRQDCEPPKDEDGETDQEGLTCH